MDGCVSMGGNDARRKMRGVTVIPRKAVYISLNIRVVFFL